MFNFEYFRKGRIIYLPLIIFFLSAHVSGEGKPNVILVMADDMGWAQTGYYGYPFMETPNLDDMAKNGLRMDRFYAGAPSCTPTRATVLTGRTNDRTGAFRVGHSINKQEKMLSTAFREAGYATAHFGKWHLNQVGPIAGELVDHPLSANDPHNPGELGFDYWLSTHQGFDYPEFELSRNGTREVFKGDGSEVIVAEAVKYIATQVTEKKPVFVVIWYSAPHGPWAAADSDVEPYLGKVNRTSANMLGEIVGIDRSIGHLRRSLKEMGIADNTLVWFTSDNGGTPDTDTHVAVEGETTVITHPSDCGDYIDPNLSSFDARTMHNCWLGVDPDSTGHLRGFKKDFYEGGLREPTVVEWPAGIKPRVSNFPSGTVDIFPTLIDLAGLDSTAINEVHDGISLAEVFKGEPVRREQPLGFRANGGWMWLDNDWKIVKNGDYVGNEMDLPYELYNVIGDPSEEHNLIQTYPDLANQLYEQFKIWSLSVSRSALGADYPEGRVLPTGRAPNPEIDDRRAVRIKEWTAEVRAAEEEK